MFCNLMKKTLVMLLMAVMFVSAAAFAETAETTESEWWNILLLGTDDRGLNSFEGRTDTIMILSVNRETNEVKLTSVMRDSWVSFPNGKRGKINAGNVYGGPEMTMQTLNETLGLDIKHYAMVNMGQLAHVVDFVDGVDFEISESERKYANDYLDEHLSVIESYPGDNYIYNSGMVHLNGPQAVSYLRNRYTDSDFMRVMRNQKVLINVVAKAQTMEVDVLVGKFEDFKGCIITNMTDDELMELAMIGLAADTTAVQQNRIPIDGTYETGTFDGTWMIRPNWEANIAPLQEFIYGE